MTTRRLAVLGHVRALTTLSAAVSLAGLVAECSYYWLWPTMPERVYGMFSLSFETNLPTWYSSSLLAAAAVGLALVAAVTRDRWRRYWWALAGCFAFMSLDESIEIHEQLGGLVGGSGVFYFDWVLIAGPAVLVLGLVFARFVLALEPTTRRRFVVAGVLYVGGALAMELPLGWWTERAGIDNIGYGLIDWVEETLELAGATLFVVSVYEVYDSRRGDGNETGD